MSQCTIEITDKAQYLYGSDGSLTISIPIRIRRHSGRKQIKHPDSQNNGPITPLQSALIRGHRWLALLESGEVKTLKEIAVREQLDDSYISRMVNLTALAPDIVQGILDDTLPANITLSDLAVDMPHVWDEQRDKILISENQ